jgi:predicted amidohydrolase YtcJ
MAFSMATAVYAKPADTVGLNGKIYTSNPKQPWAEAVAIKGTDIVYVGDNEGAKKLIGENTTTADLRGKFVMPGIISTHEHPLMVMALASGLTLEYTEDAKQMLASVKEYVEKNPDAPMFSFGGSYEGRVEIYRQDIDKIVSDKPFLMIAASGHGGWCNTKALEVAGVVKGKPDPIDSFQREKDGTPNGYLESSASTMWMLDKLGIVTKEAVMASSKATLDELAGYGITALLDNGAPYSEDAVYPAMAELEKRGDLTLRISAAVISQREVMNEAVLEKLKKYRPMYSSELFKVETLKIHGDGSPDGWTAGLLEPYADKPDSTGLTSFTPEAQRELAMQAAKLGFDITTHAIGDRTMRQTLDAYEAIRKAGYDKLRLSTGHSSLIHPDDVPRFKELNVIVNTYATKNAVPDPTWEARLGPERAKRYQPMGTLLDAGAILTMSADYPTAPVNPFLQISIAMARREPGKEAGGFHGFEEDKLTLEEAIKAYTIDAAYQLRWDNIIGSIEVGKRADLIVLDRNLFESTTDEIAETNVLATMMNGKVVHEEAVDWGIPEVFPEFDVCGDGKRHREDHDHKQ